MSSKNNRSYEREKEVAIAATRAAAQLCEQVRREIVPEAMEKKDRSPVTIADFGSQALICRALGEAFPDDPVVGEEDAAELRKPEMKGQRDRITKYVQAQIPDATPDSVPDWIDRGNGSVSNRYWTLDPIDGTKGFLRGDQYAIALALIENGDLKLGILGCPALSFGSGPTGLLFVAVRGQGANQMAIQGSEPQPIHVASPDSVTELRFVESVESAHGDQSQQAAVAKAAGIVQPSLRMDSQAKYGAVASGQAALYLRLPSPKSPNYRENIWDHAAGAIVVEEAGGRVTDMYGNPLNFFQSSKMENNRGIVVSNGTLHDTVLAALKESS